VQPHRIPFADGGSDRRPGVRMLHESR
jgi:hypothetical protein